MAKTRPARRCSARRTDGAPCGAYAIVGGTVCAAHGGSAPQVQRGAYAAEFEARMRRAFAHDWARLEKETLEWQVKRVAFATVTLGIPVEQVDTAAIWWAYASTGTPSPPRPQLRHDRRFKTPKPPTSQTRRRREGDLGA